MEVIKPARLEKDGVIGIISPASAPEDLTRIQKGVTYLESLGYRVEVGKNAEKYNGYLAGTDDQRAEDIHYMFKKKEIKAILCTRGGYGAGRLLNILDYNLIKKNPKIFVGYSDITALQMAFLNKCRMVTFAGPMIAVDFWNEISTYTEEMFWKVITSGKKYGKIKNPDDEKYYTLNKGKAESEIAGGNLALITSMLGTPYLPSFKNKILFLEEIGEAPYRIDRMLGQLKSAGILKEVSGVLLGRFKDCYDSDSNEHSLTLNEVIEDYFSKIDIPVMYNVKHGHIKDNMTLAWGIKYKMNTVTGNFEMTENAVI
jgi:muramoyltetrapeptide carboxypeptidase